MTEPISNRHLKLHVKTKLFFVYVFRRRIGIPVCFLLLLPVSLLKRFRITPCSADDGFTIQEVMENLQRGKSDRGLSILVYKIYICLFLLVLLLENSTLLCVL